MNKYLKEPLRGVIRARAGIWIGTVAQNARLRNYDEFGIYQENPLRLCASAAREV